METWDAAQHERSITTGEDLTYEKEAIKFYDIKNKAAMNNHLQKYKIYLYPTKITEYLVSMIGWFAVSHPKFTECNAASKELAKRFNITKKYDLHIHSIEYNKSSKTHTTKGAMITCNKEQVCTMKNMLYKMSNEQPGDNNTNLFDYKKLEELAPGVEVKRSYRVEVSDNVNDKAVAYKKFLAENNVFMIVRDKEMGDCKEIMLRNTGKQQPSQSTHKYPLSHLQQKLICKWHYRDTFRAVKPTQENGTVGRKSRNTVSRGRK
eukprot:286652-Ditylum_brightwellii.AAC.1